MPGPANALNISQQGMIYFDGGHTFSGIDGSTAGYICTSNGPGVAPSFQAFPGSVPLKFNGDTGEATPVSNTLYLLGTANQIVTTAAADTVTWALSSTLVLPGTLQFGGNVDADGYTITDCTISGNSTWSGNVIDLAHGGTNANLTASNGGIVYSTATAFSVLAGTATAGQILRSGSSSAPSWSTATYPATTTINQVLYSSANNVIGGITASNNGVLISGTTGIPSWLAAGSTGQVLVATTSNPPSWGTLSSLAVTSITGTSNQIATSASTGAVTLSLTNGISIGSYQATSPPTGGLLLPGQIGCGISSVDSVSQVTVSISSSRRGYYVGGTNTSTAGFDTYAGYASFASWSPSGSTSNYLVDFIGNGRYAAAAASTLSGVLASFYAAPVVSSNVGTISNLYGFFYDGGSAGAGTITNSYGAYFTLPNSGTNKHALHADNISVGSYTSGSVPPSNGMNISGGVVIGSSSLSAPAVSLLQVGDSSRASSNYIIVEASNAVDKGIAFNSSGVTRCYMIVPGGAQTTWQLYNGGQIIGADLTNQRVMIGSGTAVNKLDVNGSMAVGSGYAGSATAPANSLMCSGSFIVSSGSASTPAYTFFVDNTSGMYYTSNSLNFSTQSTLRATINSGGIIIASPGLLYTDTGTASGGQAHWFLRTTGSILRFGLGLQTVESSGNAGSNFNVYTYADNGAFLGNPISIIRSSGTVGINTGNAANTSSILNSTSTYAYNHLLNGSQTAVDGSSNQASLYVASTLSPTNGSSISAGIYCNPILTAPSTKTITAACGMYINTDSSTNVGTLSSLIGLYVGLGALTTAGTISSAYGAYLSQPLASSTGNFYALSVQGGHVSKRTATATDYTIKTADTFVAVTNTSAPRTITLPSTAPDSGWWCIVKDETNGAATNNITISRNGLNIDNQAANKTINTNSGFFGIYSNGSNYFTWTM